MKTPPVGAVGWVDLTVEDAPALRDFYAKVVGWSASPHSMGDYSDYVMQAPGGEGVAGVCHTRGTNAQQPSGWVVYFVVADMAQSVAELRERGGEVVSERKEFTVARDPQGHLFALYQHQGEE